MLTAGIRRSRRGELEQSFVEIFLEQHATPPRELPDTTSQSTATVVLHAGLHAVARAARTRTDGDGTPHRALRHDPHEAAQDRRGGDRFRPQDLGPTRLGLPVSPCVRASLAQPPRVAAPPDSLPPLDFLSPPTHSSHGDSRRCPSLKRADSRQPTADSRQPTADSRAATTPVRIHPPPKLSPPPVPKIQPTTLATTASRARPSHTRARPRKPRANQTAMCDMRASPFLDLPEYAVGLPVISTTPQGTCDIDCVYHISLLRVASHIG